MKVAILGANFLQNRLVLKAKELGIKTYVFALPEGAVAKNNCDVFFPISITEKEEILKICKKENIDGICSIASDIAVPTVNYIAEQLNLVGNSFECSRLTTNKFNMREALVKKNLPCPKYLLLGENEIEDIQNLSLSFPLIVKPVDRSGSRGIFKVNNLSELEEAIVKASRESFLDKVIVEEFIGGEEYSVEAVSINGQHKILQYTKKYTTGSPHFIEIGHVQPAELSNKIIKKIEEIIKSSLDALDIKNGISHSEIKIVNEDVKIIEIASRMGGDFIGSDLVKLSTGIDLLELTLLISLNKMIPNNKLEATKENFSMIRYIITEEEYEIMKNLENKLSKNILEKSIEKTFVETKDSTSRNGYYILSFDDKETMNKYINKIFKKEF